MPQARSEPTQLCFLSRTTPSSSNYAHAYTITGSEGLVFDIKEVQLKLIPLLRVLGLGLAAGLELLLLLLLEEEQSVDLVGDAVVRGEGVGNLLTADQGGHDTGTDDEGQDEAVHAVPVGSTAVGSGASVVVVQEGESEELADQSVLGGEEQSRPSNGRRDNTGRITLVAVLSAVSGPLKTPVDGTQEREDLSLLPVSLSLEWTSKVSTYHSTVSDLDGLDHVEQELGGLAGEDEAIVTSSGSADLVREVDGLQRSSEVGNDTGHTEVQSLLGDVRKAEGVLDHFLRENQECKSIEHLHICQRVDKPMGGTACDG